MAIEYLNDGATSFAAANWATITGTGGSGFADAATLIVPGGGASITAGLDQSAAATTGIGYLILTEPFSGNVGSSSSPLIVEASDGTIAEWRSDNTESRIEHHGTGTLYVQGSDSGIANLMQCGNGSTVLISGTATYARVQKGKFQAEAASVVTNFAAMGGTSVLGTKTSAGTLANIWGGSHTTQRPYTTMNVYGGTWIVNVYNAAAASTINQYGGTVILLGHGNTAITAYNHFAGTFDPTRLRVDTTITTYTRQIGAVFAGRPNGATLTLTNSYRKDPNLPLV